MAILILSREHTDFSLVFYLNIFAMSKRGCRKYKGKTKRKTSARKHVAGRSFTLLRLAHVIVFCCTDIH